jgi:peptidoglycan hydrolase-like protein with peptidoglycan-binding domain
VDWRKDGHPHDLLRPGTSGREVEHAQILLNRHGMHLATDGKFGPATTSAVESFQTHCRLTADGVIGDRTWTALHTY